MLELLKDCPICNHKTLSHYITCKDHLLTEENFNIVQCRDCSFLFTNPRPDKDSIGNYYQSDDYISHSNKANSVTNYIYKIARYFTLSNKVSLINQIVDQKSMLDFGCGTGEFLYSCKKDGWKIVGFEPEKNAREQATDLTGSKILSNLEEINISEKVELITLWHVLEHVHQLNETLSLLINKLTQSGKMLIAVPNHESYDAQWYREFWAAYDLPRHLYHFSRKTMTTLLNNHGLKIHRIIPMKLDSFYVSLLSEKYQHGVSNYLRSFLRGYKSNSFAKKNMNNYSSLIYIAGK